MADMVDLAERRRRIAEISSHLTEEEIRNLFPAGGIVNPGKDRDSDISVLRKRIRSARAFKTARASQTKRGGLKGDEGY